MVLTFFLVRMKCFRFPWLCKLFHPDSIAALVLKLLLNQARFYFYGNSHFLLQFQYFSVLFFAFIVLTFALMFVHTKLYKQYILYIAMNIYCRLLEIEDFFFFLDTHTLLLLNVGSKNNFEYSYFVLYCLFLPFQCVCAWHTGKVSVGCNLQPHC